MKKIAVASENGRVSEHFGHCESFIVFEAEDKQITNSFSIATPEHRPGFLPNFLYGKGINVIISGGMGGGAIEIFNEKGIEVITGASGDVKAVVEQYLQGNLKSTNFICNEHQHRHQHGCNH